MTTPAAICWAAHLGWLHFDGTRLGFIGRPISLTLFTVFALGELIADKLPQTPARTAPLGLITRIVLGGLCGIAIAANRGGSLVVAAIVGAAGAIAGTFAGYNIRRLLVFQRHLPALGVALFEDVIAVAGASLIVSHL